jgi:hypothetical protein
MGSDGLIDAYCERTGPEFWAEPVNAVTNAAFLIAALVMALRLRRRPFGAGHVLTLILAAIGAGSFLFHTFATRWAAAADVLPILAFILTYVFVASRDFLGLGPLWSAALAAAYIPYSALLVPLFARLDWLGSSAAYAPVPLLILAFALAVARRAPATARGLALGAALLIVSLTFRTIDEPLCARFPAGTHFVWHLLNALMLGWMIEVWRRHTAGPGLAERRAL